jgi:glycine cleavage system H protein
MKAETYQFPPELYYEDRAFLWVRNEGKIAAIGLTALALENLGDIVYLSLVKAGQPIGRGQPMGSIEAAKMVDSLLSPISGEVFACNEEVQLNPGLINADPYSAWLLKVKPSAWEEDSEALLHGPALERWIAEQPEEVEQ